MNDRLSLAWRPFHLPLPHPLQTARGLLMERRGWLLRLEDAAGRQGWGEAAPLEPIPGGAVGGGDAAGDGAPLETGLHGACAAAIADLGGSATRAELETRLPGLPAPVGFAIGAALAERDGLVGEAGGGWRAAPAGAWLLPAGAACLAHLDRLLQAERPGSAEATPWPPGSPLTVKWKVACEPDAVERSLLEQVLRRLPRHARLRLDANGGWDRATAHAWAERLAGEPRLEWLEQPLGPADPQGLWQLARQLPVALDESLRDDPSLMGRWSGWQVRRPLLDGDPRPLLQELLAGRPRLMLSTAFETGVGRRWLAHLAALQAEGPTPTAPGLAPGWQAGGDLGADDPETVWRAALAG